MPSIPTANPGSSADDGDALAGAPLRKTLDQNSAVSSLFNALQLVFGPASEGGNPQMCGLRLQLLKLNSDREGLAEINNYVSKIAGYYTKKSPQGQACAVFCAGISVLYYGCSA